MTTEKLNEAKNMEEEFKQKAIDYLCKRFELTEDKIKHGDWNFLFQKYIEMYIVGATEATKELQEQIEKMKRDVFECFGSEYNMLVAKLFTEWEIKEK